MNKNIDFSIKFEMEHFAQQLFLLLIQPNSFEKNYNSLEPIFLNVCTKLDLNHSEEKWRSFKPIFRSVQQQVIQDAEALERNDPAAKSINEVLLSYPGLFAIAIYRISHIFHKMNIPLLPRMISEYAHSYTGADIHPGAIIGDSFFIDHATGIVIGETVIIGDHVKIYQGVTLGAFHIKKNMTKVKRHPTIEDHVTIYANATILGGDTVIGHHSTIGGSVWLTETIAPNSFVSFQSSIKIKSIDQSL